MNPPEIMFEPRQILVGVAEVCTLLATVATAAVATPIVFDVPDDPGLHWDSGTHSGRTRCTKCATVEAATPTLDLLGEANARTVSANPTFFWAVMSDRAIPVEFSLMHGDTLETIFTTEFSSAERQGEMMRFQLPEDIELEEWVVYTWEVMAVCDEVDPFSNVLDWGWVVRTEADGVQPGELGLEAAQRYADGGFWYDALAALESDAERFALMEAYSQEQVDD